MANVYRIEWDGPPSPDHEAHLRRAIAATSAAIGDPAFPRGSSYIRVPLVLGDEDGPGIDCHWDNHRNTLVCLMDIEDGPLPEELEGFFEGQGEAIDLFEPLPRIPRKH
ncbi:hypothetical protein [Primorskyibacter sp. S87]|uniref:hypothetical protein n=1 Tax=Primorskyibacter sp. S87 TaxID=3415126 RepID=UPI003C7D91CE